MRKLMLCAALAALGGRAPNALAAPDDDIRKEFDEFRRHAAEVERQYQQRISDLEKRVAERPPAKPSDLEAQIDGLLDRIDLIDSKVASARPSAGSGRAAYIDVALNALFTAGSSTAPEAILDALQGGGHDPKKRGFTVQNTELVLSGAVDPYFRGQMNLIHQITSEGETLTELEEAFAVTTSLPAGLQIKAGQYFTEFGRLNPQHPHQWEFVDQPVVNSRFFGGDGMRGPGARVSWLAPTSFPLEMTLGAQNANGETMVSFLGTREEEPPFGVHVDRSVASWNDLVASARAAASFDLTDEMPLLIGTSGALGPSGASSNASTSIVGADITLKWKPLANDRGFPFVAFQTEWMRRHAGYDSFVDGTTFVPGGELQDSGEYAQIVYGFQRDWTAGLRYDRIQGTDDDVFGRDDRTRWSAAITYYTSEFAKIRLQMNLDDSAALDRRVASLWLQLEFNLGAHGAHKF